MIHIPPDAKVVRDSRLTLIRTISTLHDSYIKGKNGLKDKVVADLLKKKASYAESDHVVARLADPITKTTINPAKFFKLLKAKKITEEQFLGCISVGKGAVEEILAPPDIDAISDSAGEGSRVLFSEFKPGISAAIDALDLSGIAIKMLLNQSSGGPAIHAKM